MYTHIHVYSLYHMYIYIYIYFTRTHTNVHIHMHMHTYNTSAYSRDSILLANNMSPMSLCPLQYNVARLICSPPCTGGNKPARGKGGGDRPEKDEFDKL